MQIHNENSQFPLLFIAHKTKSICNCQITVQFQLSPISIKNEIMNPQKYKCTHHKSTQHNSKQKNPHIPCVNLLPFGSQWMKINFQTFDFRTSHIIFTQMKTVLQRELADVTENNMRDIEIQLKECSSFSAKQICTSAKRLKNKTFAADYDRIISRNRNHTQIQPTEEGLTTKPLRQNQFDESVNSLMASKSTGSNNVGTRPLWLGKKTCQIKQRKKKWKQLKDVLLTQKVNALKDIFCTKIKRNNPFSKPVQFQIQSDPFSKSIFDHKGIELKQSVEKVTSMLFIYNVVSSIFIFTLSMVFPEIREQLSIRILEILGTLLFALEIVLNFITVRFSLGRKLQNINQISKQYMRHKFPIDCINLLVILAFILTEQWGLNYFRLITLLKLPDCMERLQKLQIFFIENYYNEQYWSLFKVFLFNFCFAHMLAILLIAMSKVNPTSNWLQSKNIPNAHWFQKYIWSYYWATTTMLTIGFGDFTPVCYQQAMCMIFIETISCMVLAYNINCVGSLIANIRSQDIEKSKSMKIFKKLSDKHGINESLSWKINNYIEEHTNIKKLFNIEEQVQFVEKLPTAFRTDYLKQANKSIFQKLFFFNHLMQKTLFSLAEKIEMKITHPEQVILNSQKNFDIFILKNGQLGYTSRKINRKYNSIVFDKMKVEESGSPFLLNTNFITKNRAPYGIKSLVYSVLYYLEYDALIDILKDAHLDYELYCRERDKNKNKIDEFQVFPCEYCTNQKHTKFLCPKLHFVPIQQHIMNKYIHKEKKGRNLRDPKFQRIDTPKQSSLRRYLYNKEIYDQKKFQEATQTVTKKFKKQKFVVDQLKNLENDDGKSQFSQLNKSTQLSNMQIMTKLQTKFFESTTELIKVHINKALGQGKGEDDVWLIELDKMKNYRDYFPENNACNLVVTFNYEQRLKGIFEKSVCEIIAKTCTGDVFTMHDMSNSMGISSVSNPNSFII